MSLSLTEQILDRQPNFRALAIDSTLALAVGTLLATGVTYGWWTLVFGIPVLCAFAFFAVHARQETLMVAYVFVLTLLACLQVSLLIEVSPSSYAMVGLGRYALMGGLVVWGLVVFHKYPSSLKT